jgi:16S rRNA (adenine1518-N6/adenine1519-N6)-dimethyltransferase
VAYHADAALVRRVPPEVFWPRPSVGSVLVRLDRWPRPPVEADPEVLWRVVDEAFSQRRKTMRGALRRLGFDTPSQALEAAQIPASARPEELGLVDFANLAAMMAP